MTYTRRCQQPKSHRFFVFFPFLIFLLKSGGKQPMLVLLRKWKMKYWQKRTWHLVASQQPMSDLPLCQCLEYPNMQTRLTISLLTWWSQKRRNCRNKVYLLHLIRILSAPVLKNLSLCFLGIQGAHLVQMLDDPAHSASDKTLSVQSFSPPETS